MVEHLRRRDADIYVDGVQGSSQTIGGVLQNLGPTPDRVMIGARAKGVSTGKG